MSNPSCYSARMKINMNIWPALETGTNAIPSVWRERIGAQFDTVRNAFLQSKPEPAQYFHCRKCGCAHQVTIHAPGDIVAVCTCDPWNCDELMLTAADIEILELNWAKLARALCKAFGLNARTADLGLHNTRQIGSWSADAVPVILTIQRERHDFQHVVAVLAARLRTKFILLGPTTENLDATSQELLTNVGAEFFSLQNHLVLTDHGTFQPRKLPGEIFARFRPEPVDDIEMLRKSIALVKAADTAQGVRRITLYTVMRLYCFDLLGAAQIAKRCGCARSLIYARLDEIRIKIGRDPAELRQYASQFETMEDSLTDSRAEHIHRKSAINEQDDSNGDG
jgi:hypothetical protein